MNAVTEPSDAEPTAVAASSKKRTMFGGISAKLVALLLVFGLAPAAMLTGILYSQEDGIKAALTSKVASTAVAVNDVIDRNLFERYGDVQAFGLNAAARDPANWGKPGDANPLVGAMNGYMTGYGIYRLMLLLSPEGKVIAANSMRADGKKLATGALYGRSFAEAKWFRRVMEGNFLNGRNGFTGTAVDQPYREKLVADLYGGDGYVIPFSAPVRDAAGRTVAVWVNFADFGLVEEIVATFHAGSTKENMTDTEITILDPEGRVIADYDPVRLGIKSVRDYKRNPEVIGKLNLAESGVEAAQRAIRGESGAMVSMHSRKKIVQAAGYAKSIGAYDYPGLGWSTLVRIPDNEAFTLWDNLIAIMLIAVAISAGTIVLAGLFLGNGAARPIRKLSETMMTLAGGDKTVDVPLTGRADEFGDMARTVQVFKDNMIETERLQAEQRAAEKRAQEEELQRTAEKRAAEAKAGEERRAAEEKAEQDRKQALLKMADTFEKSVMGVVKAVASATTEMQSSAQAMSSTAEETSRQATSVASASEEASTNVQTVATAAEELSASVEEIGRQVKQSNEIAQSAVSQAKDTNDKVEGLANAAQKIGEVVNLINDIASQTNLLALNATIEAARAGDAGKGFAVVASEVKSLANQTAKATEDIAGQITAIQGATAEAVQAIQTIGRTIGEIGEIATTVAAAVDQQGSATREIAGSVQQAAIGTQEVSSNIVQVTQAATESQAASSQMLSAAQELAQQGEVLRGEVEKFLETVRAA